MAGRSNLQRAAAPAAGERDISWRDHYQLAFGIFDAVIETLEQRSVDGRVSVAAFHDAAERLRKALGAAEPVFENACVTCKAAAFHAGRRSAAAAEGPACDKRRRDYISRLLCSLVLHQKRWFDKTLAANPRAAIPLVTAVTSALFTPSEREFLNQHLQGAFALLDHPHDDSLWAEIAENPLAAERAQRVLLRAFMALTSSLTRVRTEIERVQAQPMHCTWLMPMVPALAVCDLIRPLADRLQAILNDEEACTAFAMLHGPDMLPRVEAGLLAYRRYREGVTPTGKTYQPLLRL